MKPNVRLRKALFCPILALAIAGGVALPGRTSAADDPAGARRNAAFTLDEALAQLRLYPKDPYLQYVALQLARRTNRMDEIAGEIGILRGNGQWNLDPGRRDQVDLFSVFTGALAIQESLQLDTMRGGAQRRQVRPADPFGNGAGRDQDAAAAQKALELRRREMVDVASLAGSTIKSHPWEKMLGDKKPDVGPLARKVPEDFFFAEFGSLTKMLDVLDSGELWSKHLFHQTSGEARSQQVGERLKRQLVVETNPLVRPFYDLVVEEVAIVGSDLFFNEGSDLTLLFKFKQPAVFKARMDGFLQTAEKADAKLKRSTGKINGVEYVHLESADRTVHVYSAYPEANLHVRSNSLAALQRVLAAVSGKSADGPAVRKLGETSEFAYIRTLMPRGAKDEDGFLYLSDAFMRRMVGPELKLTERRRVLCYNHLRMIGHAALMYRSEFGAMSDSLETLAKKECAPGVFGKEALACPDGGTYALSADGTTGVCSHHGHVHDLVPCAEHPVAKVTGEEADEYNAFLAAYNQYWRTFFDPIGVRIKVSPEQYRLETIVLPLIDNTVYTSLAMALGGRPEPLDALPVPDRNIFTVNFRFDKIGLAEKAGWKKPEPDSKEETLAGNHVLPAKSANNLRQIGLALHNYHDAFSRFPGQAIMSKDGKPLLSWRVMLLPYVNEAALYNEFHLDEPWDSAHNKKLVDRIPAVYQSLTAKAKKPGQTTYLAPVGKNLMFTGEKEGVRIADVTDGTSNTIFMLQADEAHAVAWTKPEDVTIDLKKPATGLVNYAGQGSAALIVDGSAGFLREGIESTRLAALLTRNDGTPASANPPDFVRESQRQQGFGLFGGLRDETFEKLGGPRLVLEGLGNQVGLHVYDSPPTFDFNLPSFLGQALGSFSGRNMMGGSEMLPISFLIASLNSPVYVSIPVQDAAIVDQFLEGLEGVMASEMRRSRRSGWFGIEYDYYRMKTANVPVIRCASLAFGPVKFRIFWARIGGGLYIASKPFILDDLATIPAKAPAGPAAPAAAPALSAAGPTAHAMFRIRSRNWNQVLPDYRLGWAENNRCACLDNLGPLSSVSRVSPANEKVLDVWRSADRLYGAHFFCPEGGQYERTADGRGMTCSVHGTALAPKQAAAPAQDQALGKLLSGFGGLEATLTFLEDGLHAVVKIDRK